MGVNYHGLPLLISAPDDFTSESDSSDSLVCP